MYTTPIINSKAAEEHLAKIKAEHTDMLVNMQQHKDRIAQEKMMNDQNNQVIQQQKQQQVVEQKKQETEMMKHQFEQEKMKNEFAMKQQELAIKQRALSAE